MLFVSQHSAGGTETDFLSVPTKLRKSVGRELGRQFLYLQFFVFFLLDLFVVFGIQFPSDRSDDPVLIKCVSARACGLSVNVFVCKSVCV